MDEPNKKGRIKAIDDAAGLWKDMPETGIEYEKRLRKEWRNRVTNPF